MFYICDDLYGIMSNIVTQIQMMEKADESQIQSENENQTFSQAYAYDIDGKIGISYRGIQKMKIISADSGESFGFRGDINVDLIKHSEDINDWVWSCTLIVYNKTTELEAVGASEQPYLKDGQRDKFARTIAISKADRNATRKLFSERDIDDFLTKLGPNEIQRITSGNPDTVSNVQPNINDNPSTKNTNISQQEPLASDKQLAYLEERFDFKTTYPLTRKQASVIIGQYQEKDRNA